MPKLKIAVVHTFFDEAGGGERLALEMVEKYAREVVAEIDALLEKIAKKLGIYT